MKLSLSLGKNKKGSIKLGRVTKGMTRNLHAGLTRSGYILEAQIKQHLDNNILQRRTSRLYSSVTTQVKALTGGLQLKVGPNVVYAAIHEFGGWAGKNNRVRIPARPYVFPAWEKKKSEVMAEIKRQIFTRPTR